MPSTSTLRPTSLKGSLLSQIPLVLSMGLGAALTRQPATGVILGGALFLAWRMVGVREVLCRDHRRGIRLARSGEPAEALIALQDSEAFWVRHPTLDRYRWFFLGSAGPYSFLTLARYNQAYCLTLLKRHRDALAVLEKVLSSSPGMIEARELRDELQSEDLKEESTWDDPKGADRTWTFDDLFPNSRDET